VICVLDAGLLDTPYSLTEARVLYELAQAGSIELLDLRRRLDIDPSYLSRIVGRFKADGVLVARTSRADGRRQVLRLTAKGRDVFAMLDERSAAQNRELLSRIETGDRRRLVDAIELARAIVEAAPPSAAFALRGLRAGDLGWVVARHGALYAQEHGWDASFEALVARIVADYVERQSPGRERAWIAELDGEPAGCVFCVERDADTAQLRLLLVEPRARGHGIGGALVAACVDFARAAGYRQLVLWTNDVLTSARRLYEAAGFRLIEAEPHESFGRRLVGQHWLRELA
jgi:DNA-binding MarR family transcriptional regulator/N-acetylglutamate synthase-like GNAT family acetyltransferase